MSLLALIIIATLAAYFILTYHRLTTQIDTVRHNQNQINMQLDRRAKLLTALVEEVKKYVDIEQTPLKEVLDLRNLAEQAKLNSNEITRIAAENQISAVSSQLGLIFEQYADLKINSLCLQLRLDISKSENKLAYAKHAYNNSLEIYQANKNMFPAMLLMPVFRKVLDVNFIAWQTVNQPENLAEQTSYSVQL